MIVAKIKDVPIFQQRREYTLCKRWGIGAERMLQFPKGVMLQVFDKGDFNVVF